MPAFKGVNITAFGMSIENSSQWNAVIDGKFEIIKFNLTSEGGKLHLAFQKNIPPIILMRIQDLFWMETTPEGIDWKQLAPWTVRVKEESGYEYIQNPGILQATRGFYNSLYSTPTSGWEIVSGSNDPVAKKHQFGAIKLPARPWLGWSNQMEIDVQSTMQKLVNEVSLTL